MILGCSVLTCLIFPHQSKVLHTAECGSCNNGFDQMLPFWNYEYRVCSKIRGNKAAQILGIALYSALSRIRGSARLTNLYRMMAEPIFSESLINKEFLLSKPRHTLQPAKFSVQFMSLVPFKSQPYYQWPCHPEGFSVRCLGYLDSLGLQTPSNPCS